MPAEPETPPRLPGTCGCGDINLGCSGYVKPVWPRADRIRAAEPVLFLQADTYSKAKLNPRDKSVRSVLADGAADTL